MALRLWFLGRTRWKKIAISSIKIETLFKILPISSAHSFWQKGGGGCKFWHINKAPDFRLKCFYLCFAYYYSFKFFFYPFCITTKQWKICMLGYGSLITRSSLIILLLMDLAYLELLLLMYDQVSGSIFKWTEWGNLRCVWGRGVTNQLGAWGRYDKQDKLAPRTALTVTPS